MKKSLPVMLIIFISLSCTFFKETITIDQAVKEKSRIDGSENPARKFLIRKKLEQKYIELKNITVKDIIVSANIDYDFCIVADVKTPKGIVECYIYTKSLRTISKLEKGKSRINVKGIFGRFFTILDKYYTKIDIIKADVDIIKGDQK